MFRPCFLMLNQILKFQILKSSFFDSSLFFYFDQFPAGLTTGNKLINLLVALCKDSCAYVQTLSLSFVKPFTVLMSLFRIWSSDFWSDLDDLKSRRWKCGVALKVSDPFRWLGCPVRKMLKVEHKAAPSGNQNELHNESDYVHNHTRNDLEKRFWMLVLLFQGRQTYHFRDIDLQVLVNQGVLWMRVQKTENFVKKSSLKVSLKFDGRIYRVDIINRRSHRLTHGEATGKTNAKLTPMVTGIEK